MIIAIIFLFLPLKGGCRRVKRAGWGLHDTEYNPTPLAFASLWRATLPFQGRDKESR